ncbi:MAG: hypothetical protein JW931_05540 [Methanomicrobiaceae archaeon]|nr:hypothetical protein [Methanomicrobiaceae archaeon]
MENQKVCFTSFFKNPIIKYAVPTSFLSCIFGFILYLMTSGLVTYGNYNNTLGGFVPVYFYFMSITASLLAAYRASRNDRDAEIVSVTSNNKVKALYGIISALIVSLTSVFIYVCLALTIIHNMIFEFMIALQFWLAPLPAAILGGLIGYFFTGNYFPGGEGSLKGYIMIVSAILLLELAFFLILIYSIVGMGLIPYDPGRVVMP